MNKIKRKKIINRLFTFVLMLTILLNSSLVYGKPAEINSINVEYVTTESIINPDDFIIQVSDDKNIKILVQNSNEGLFDFSIGEIILNEYDLSPDIFYLNIDEHTSPSAITVDTEPVTRASLPDLQVYNITPYGTYPFSALGTAKFSVPIVNFGSATANASTCGVFVDGQLTGTFSVPSLQAGYGYEPIISINGIPAGNHIIKVQADYYGVISESNELNNIKTATFTWTGTPDLIVSNFNASTATPVVGTNVTFNFTIANIGNADANGTIYTAVLVNGSSVGTFSIRNLGVQETASGSFILTFPNNSTYNVQLKTDSTNAISESNENNNTSSSIAIKPKIADKVTITGTLQYNSYENYGGSSTLRNLSNYEVKIYDKNPVGSTLKATTITDSRGRFSAVIDNETGILENGSDIYLAIPMDNSYLNISGQGIFNSTYQFETPVYEDYQESTLDFGTMALDSSETMKGALNIYHWIKVAKDYYQSNASSLGKISIKWSEFGNKGNEFDGSSIFISGTDFGHYSSTVITHEYGHYIMDYKNVNPSNAGGEHFFDSPSLYTGTAYSEAYATFISLHVRNSTIYEHWYALNTFFGADFETLDYLSSSGNSPVPRRSIFYENAKMELFTGGAMLDFADSANDGWDTYNGGFNDVNNVVMSRRLNNSIEFYDAYMNKTSSSNKVLAWRIFNQNNSAFDYTLPTVSITGNNISGYTAVASDDVGISKIEWYLNGSLVSTGNTYKPPSNLPMGTHSVLVRAYDYEGNERGRYDREDINGNIIRTTAYSSASTQFVVNTSQTRIPNEVVTDLYIESPELTEFTSKTLFEFSSSQQYGRVNARNMLVLDENTDLYFTGIINGAVDNINIVNKNNEVEASVEGVYSNDFTVMQNISAGEYALEINTIDDIQNISYYVSVFAVPTVPVLDFPKSIGEANTIEISNPYSNQLNISVNDREYKIKPFESLMLTFDEGENKLSYYSENVNGKSKITEKTVFCDTIAPEVSIIKAVSNDEMIVVTGQISEYVDNLHINGDRVTLGEFNIDGKPITFDYISYNPNVTVLNIEAIDALGNSFKSIVYLHK